MPSFKTHKTHLKGCHKTSCYLFNRRHLVDRLINFYDPPPFALKKENLDICNFMSIYVIEVCACLNVCLLLFMKRDTLNLKCFYIVTMACLYSSQIENTKMTQFQLQCPSKYRKS